MQTSKQKLDEILGISADQSIDDFLDDMQMQSDEIDDQIKENVAKVDQDLATLSSASFLTDLAKTDEINKGIMASLNEIKDLISVSNSIVKHVYQSIITSDLVDSELIGAAAKLIESTHINMQDHLDIYKSRLAFYDKIRFEMFKYQHDIEKMKIKHQLDLDKMKMKADDSSNVEEGEADWSQEKITKMMNDYDKQLRSEAESK